VGSWGHQRAGEPLFGNSGAFAVVHGVCGDLAWFQERLRVVECAPNAARPCPWCRCDRAAMSFNNLTVTAPWVGTVLQPPRPAPSSAPIWLAPGLNIFTVRLDIMHVFDLGILAHFLGSVLWTLVFEPASTVPGGTAAGRMRHIWARCLDLYGAHRISCRFSRIEIKSFTDPGAPRRDFPVLKGKAAENRGFLTVARALCAEFNAGSARDCARLSCAVALGRFYEILNASGRHIEPARLPDARRFLLHALDQYMRLSAFSTMEAGLRLFNITNKAHFAMHVALNLGHMNPELTWTYQFEDLVGRSKRVALACSSGTRPTLIPQSFMRRYRRVVHVALR
jgi:hypothetical protein